jgi:arylsulfatase A-like enzyme
MSVTRREFLATTAAGVATSGALAASDTRTTVLQRNESMKTRPNILWICTDQQRWDTIRSLGNEHIRTPNIDRLVANGVAFTHAHCQSPICTPSRASFLTGMYPSAVHGCMNGADAWDDAAPLVTKTLADAGYDCGLAGKFHLSAAQGRIEKRADDGYRVFDWSHHPHDDWPKGHAYVDWLKGRGIDYTATYKKQDYIDAEHHQTTWCAERAVAFMKENCEKPWLFSFNCFDPHSPFDPPKSHLDRFDADKLPGPVFRESDLAAQKKLQAVNFQNPARRPEEFDAKTIQAKYWAMIELIDDAVGTMLKGLKESGQLENTVVIFTSDHGEMAGDHGLLLKGCRFYEGLVRVPLVVSWPGRFKQGLRSDELVELTDLAPTLLELAGLDVPATMQGKSLLPLLTGEERNEPHREFVRCEYYRALRGVQSFGTMIRTKQHKLTVYHGHELGELFDLQKDPDEFDNLWDSPKHADIRFDLLRKNFDALALSADVGAKRTARY